MRNNEAKHAFEQLRGEIKDKNLEEITSMLRISLDAQIEELKEHSKTAHLNYLQQTAQRTHDLNELTQNDQKLSEEIEKKRLGCFDQSGERMTKCLKERKESHWIHLNEKLRKYRSLVTI